MVEQGNKQMTQSSEEVLIEWGHSASNAGRPFHQVDLKGRIGQIERTFDSRCSAASHEQ
jgi:hypothetical protein